MFCSNCGSNIGENELFCSVCGTKVVKDEQNNTSNQDSGQQSFTDDTQAQEQNFNQTQGQNINQAQDFNQSQNFNQAQDFNQSQNFNQAQGQPFVTGQFQPNSVPPVMPKKKGGAGKIIAIVGGAVAIVAVATVGTLAATGKLGNFFRKNFTSPESYFKYVAEKRTDDAIESLNSSYSTAVDSLSSTSSSMSGNCSVKLEAGDELKPLMGLIDPSLKNLDNATISVNSSIDDTVQNMEIKANINDTDIATVKASIDIDNEIGYIQIPELSDAYIDISDGVAELSNNSYTSSSEYQEAVSQLQEALPDAKTTSSIIDTYINIALDNISDVSKSSKKIEAEGVSQECTALTTTLDGKYCYNTASDILDALKDDKDIKEIIESIDELDYDEFQDEIEEASERLEENEDEFDDIETEAELTLYVDGKGEVAGTEISVTSGSEEVIISSIMPKSNSKFGYEMKVGYNDSDLFKMVGNGTLKKDVMNGEFSISIGDELLEEVSSYISDGEDVVILEIKDLNVKDCNEGNINGSFTFSSDKISAIEGYKLTADFASTDNEASVAISVSSDGSDWAKLTITAGKGEEIETIEPSDSDKVYSISDEDDLNEFIDEIDIETFVGDVIDASGVDIETSDVIEMIEDLFASGYDNDYYDNYNSDYDDDYSSDYDYDYNSDYDYDDDWSEDSYDWEW